MHGYVFTIAEDEERGVKAHVFMMVEGDTPRMTALKPQNMVLDNPATLEEIRAGTRAPFPGVPPKCVAALEAAWAGDLEAIFSLAGMIENKLGVDGLPPSQLIPRTAFRVRVCQTLELVIACGVLASILIPRTAVHVCVFQTLEMAVAGGVHASILIPRTAAF